VYANANGIVHVLNVVSLNQPQGEQSITGRSFPQYWYIVYAEPSSCDPTMPSLDTYVYYELHLYNSDYHGNPTNHLGADQKGTLFD